MSLTLRIWSFRIHSSTAWSKCNKTWLSHNQLGIKTLLTCGRKRQYLVEIKCLCWARHCNSSKRQSLTSSVQIKTIPDLVRWAARCSLSKRRRVSFPRVERKAGQQLHKRHLRYHHQKQHQHLWILAIDTKKFRNRPIKATSNTSLYSSKSFRSVGNSQWRRLKV